MFRKLVEQAVFGERLQVRFQRMRLFAVIDFVPVDVECKSLQIFCLFNGVVDRVFGPLIKRVLVDTLRFRGFAIPGKGVVLAFKGGVVLREDIAEG